MVNPSRTSRPNPFPTRTPGLRSNRECGWCPPPESNPAGASLNPASTRPRSGLQTVRPSRSSRKNPEMRERRSISLTPPVGTGAASPGTVLPWRPLRGPRTGGESPFWPRSRRTRDNSSKSAKVTMRWSSPSLTSIGMRRGRNSGSWIPPPEMNGWFRRVLFT